MDMLGAASLQNFFPVRARAQGSLCHDGVALVPASISTGSANSFQHNYSLWRQESLLLFENIQIPFWGIHLDRQKYSHFAHFEQPISFEKNTTLQNWVMPFEFYSMIWPSSCTKSLRVHSLEQRSRQNESRICLKVHFLLSSAKCQMPMSPVYGYVVNDMFSYCAL